jgi:hypothetical protein
MPPTVNIPISFPSAGDLVAGDGGLYAWGGVPDGVTITGALAGWGTCDPTTNPPTNCNASNSKSGRSDDRPPTTVAGGGALWGFRFDGLPVSDDPFNPVTITLAITGSGNAKGSVTFQCQATLLGRPSGVVERTGGCVGWLLSLFGLGTGRPAGAAQPGGGAERNREQNGRIAGSG